MSAHPLHGTKPLAEALRTEAQFSGKSNLYLFKLQRVRQYVPIHTASTILVKELWEAHPSGEKFVGHAIMEGDRNVAPGPDAMAWGEKFPGWQVRFA